MITHKKYAAVAAVFVVSAITAYSCVDHGTDLEKMRSEKVLELDSLIEEQKGEVDRAQRALDAQKSSLDFLTQCREANSNTGVYVDCARMEMKHSVEVVPKVDAQYAPALNEHSSTAQVPILEPKDLFGPTKVSDKCYITQTENEHVIPKNGGMFATDIACNFGEGLGKRAEVYAPDLRDEVVEYTVEYVGHDALLGSFLQLRVLDSDESFYIAHTETRLKHGDKVRTGQRIGQMILDGATTGWHVHFEYRRLSPTGVWMSQRYFTGKRDEAIDNKRKGTMPTGWKEGDKFYFTHYTLGDVNQNDAAPCVGASGKDLCALEKSGVKTIALTADVRTALGVKFGDSIRLEGPCAGTYEVHDEMASRFRFSNIMRDGYPIKGDIPSCGGGVHAVFLK